MRFSDKLKQEVGEEMMWKVLSSGDTKVFADRNLRMRYRGEKGEDNDQIDSISVFVARGTRSYTYVLVFIKEF